MWSGRALLKKFLISREPVRPIYPAEASAYAADCRGGGECLCQIVDADWVAFLREAVEADLVLPGALHNNIARDGRDSFRSDTFVLANIPVFSQFMTEAPAPPITANVMDYDKVNLLFDQILSKEPATSTETM